MARREWQVALVWLNKIIDVYPDRASARMHVVASVI